jgi:hypothetical protein
MQAVFPTQARAGVQPLTQHVHGRHVEEDRHERRAACPQLSKARLERVSSRPTWGLLVRGSALYVAHLGAIAKLERGAREQRPTAPRPAGRLG